MNMKLMCTNQIPVADYAEIQASLRMVKRGHNFTIALPPAAGDGEVLAYFIMPYSSLV